MRFLAEFVIVSLLCAILVYIPVDRLVAHFSPEFMYTSYQIATPVYLAAFLILFRRVRQAHSRKTIQAGDNEAEEK